MATPIPQTNRCPDGSTYAITGVQLLDENDNPVLSKVDVEWSMCDQSGNQVASGTVTPALSMNIVFEGSETTVTASELAYAELNRQYRTVNQTKVYWVTRRVYVKGVADTTLGTDKDITGEFIFYIDNISCLSPAS